MKYIIYLFPALIFALAVDSTSGLAAEFQPSSEVLVLAQNGVELDVTMEMLDEEAQSSSDIIHVIELPVQEMRQEQIRNERRIRQNDEASPLRQGQGAAGGDKDEIVNEIGEIQQEAESAKRNIYDDPGQQKGR